MYIKYIAHFFDFFPGTRCKILITLQKPINKTIPQIHSTQAYLSSINLPNHQPQKPSTPRHSNPHHPLKSKSSP